MKYLVLAALVLAGCSQEPRQYGAPIPLQWSTPTFDAPALGVGAVPTGPMILDTPRGGVVCQRLAPNYVYCS